MARLKRLRMRRFLPVSWLGTLHYCAYQLYLREVVGVRLAPTQAMMAGAARHLALEADHLAEAAEELTVEEALRRSRYERTAFAFRELLLTSPRHGLRGLADEVTFHPDRVLVVDDKPVARAWASDVAQVWGYCLALQDAHAPDRPLWGAVRNRENARVVWCAEFDGRARETVLADVNRLWAMLRGEAPWTDNAGPARCRACRYAQSCERRVG